ncbi:MAG: hypothetical protein R3263_10090, partial [Myxococcota bacterium]|nr:hypothetical protein [Myxococcota bacterium]
MADASKPDPIERAFFREGPDGAAVFFPWGLTGLGYRLLDPAAKKKATRAASWMVGGIVAVGGWGGHALHRVFEAGDVSAAAAARALALPLAVLAGIFVAYAARVARLVERFPASDLQVSRDER